MANGFDFNDFKSFGSGFSGSGFSSGFGSTGSSKLTPEQEQLLLQAQAAQLGMEVTKPKTSILQKIARVLNAPRAIVGGIQKYGPTGALKGLSEDLDTAKLLEEKLGRPLTTMEKAKAIATDVALDPLTYITAGVGTGAKIATQQGVKVLSREGTKVLAVDMAKQLARVTEEEIAKNTGKTITKEAAKSMLERAAEERAQKLMARKIEQGAGNYTQKAMIRVGVPGVRSLSVGILPEEKLTKPIVKLSETIAKAPIVGDPYQKTIDLFGRAFVKDYDVSKTVSELRRVGDPESLKKASELEAFKSLKQNYLKGTAAEKEDALKKIITQARTKDLSTREEILKFLERPPMSNGVQAGTEEIMSVHKTLNEIYKAGGKDVASMEKAVAKAQILENVPGIGVTKAAQLRAVGINSLDDLARADSQQLAIAMDAKYADIFKKAGYGATPDFVKSKMANLTAERAVVESVGNAKRVAQIDKELATLTEAARGGVPGANVVEKTADLPKLAGAYQKVEAGRKGAVGYESLLHQQELLTESLRNDIENARSIRAALNGSIDNIADPSVKQGATYIKQLNKNIAKKDIRAGIFKSDQELENYVHRILTPEARQAIQSSKGGMAGFSKQISTSIGSAAKHRSNPLTILESEGAMQAKYGLKGDFYIKDPYLTTAIREQTSIGARNTKGFYDDVMTQFGRPAESRQYEVFTKEGTAKKSEWISSVDEETGMEYVVPNIKEFQDAGVSVPRAIAKDIEKTHQALSSIPELRDFVRVFDKVQGLWKSGVTGLFPAFHARNMVGGMFNNWLAGISSPAVYARADDLLKRVGKLEKAITPEAQKAANEAIKAWRIKDALGHDISGLDLIRAYDMKVGRGTGRSADLVKDVSQEMATGKGADFVRATGYGKKILSFTEERLRLPLFMDTWKKTGSFDDAAANVFKYHFDYSPEGMTQFENQYMKRVIPFYRWVRGNIPLQFEQMLRQPGKASNTLRAMSSFIDPSIKEQMPEYMQQGTAVQLAQEKNGIVPVLTGLGLPIEDMNKLGIKDIAGSISPLIRYPAEAVTGQSIFYRKPIDELGGSFAKYYANGALSALNVNNWMEIQEIKQADGTIKYVGNPQKLYAMQQAVGRFTTTIGKASDQNVPAWTRMLGAATGAQVKNVDVEQERQYRIREINDRLNKVLVQKGVKKEYTDYYTPKGVTVSPIRPAISLGGR